MAGTIAITWSVVILIVGALILIVGLMNKKAPTRKMLGVIGGIMVGVMVVAIIAGAGGALPTALDFLNKGIFGQSVVVGGTTITYATVGGQPQPSGNVNVQTYQPTASYSTVNHFSNVVLTGGTVYYKAGNQKASTTAVSNTDPNTQYQYWYSNGSYYVKPYLFMGGGTKTIVNQEAYANGTDTINGYDLINDKAIGATAYNTSLSSGTAKFKFTVMGSATTANLPFGGLLVIEANSTISQISCSGDGISQTSGKFALTYTPTSLSDRYVVYEIAPGYDVSPDGLIGVIKTINCDFTSSTNPGAGSAFYIKTIPANYYIVNSDGSFALDTEQKLNGVTTRTNLGISTSTFYWG